MSAVTFVAATSAKVDGWPERLVGNGFIHVDYYDSSGSNAIYRDQFGEQIEVACVGGLIVGDVRED